MESEELLPLVDPSGRVIGSAPRSRCHSSERLLHPVVHLHLFDKSGRLLLQLRSASKLIQPGKWDTAVGGHVSFGESISEALKREAEEEIGLTDFVPGSIVTYLFESPVERELIHCHTAEAPDGFIPIREESDIDELRFFTTEEIDHMISDGLTTPNFALEYRKYISHVHK